MDGLYARYNISVKPTAGNVTTPYQICWEKDEYVVTFTTEQQETLRMKAYTHPSVVGVDVQFASDNPQVYFEPNKSKTNETGWVSTNLTLGRDVVSDCMNVIKAYVLSWFAGDVATVKVYKTLVWIVSDYENFSKCTLHNTQIVDDGVTLNTTGNWLNGWKYRRILTIHERSGRDLFNYQIKIVLNSTNFNFSKASPNDLRFTDSDGKTLLKHWIQTWNNQRAVIWVKVPSIQALSTKIIYIYYGNPSATSTSDANAVFEFFDDFNDGDVSDWSMEANVRRGHVEVSDEHYHSHPYSLITFFKAPYDGWGRKLYVRAYRSFTVDVDFDYMVEFYTRSNPCIGCKIYSEMFIDGNRVFRENIPREMVYRSLRIHLDRGNHEIKVGMFTTAAWFGRFPAWFDDVRIRKIVDPEPYVTVGREETPRYLTSGYVRSYVKDLGENSTVKFLQWDGSLREQTEMEFWIRASNTSFDQDNTSLNWIYVGKASEGKVFMLDDVIGRYVQWNVTLRTMNETRAPYLDEVVVGYLT